MKRKDKNSLGERICRVLELPAEALPRKSAVEIHGRSLVKIHGGGAILLYSPDEIRIALCDTSGYLSVKGKALRCSSYNMGAVGIDGYISSVAFGDKEGGESR